RLPADVPDLYAPVWHRIAAEVLRAQAHRATGPSVLYPALGVRYGDPDRLVVRPHAGRPKSVDGIRSVTHLARLSAAGLPMADLHAAAAAEAGAMAGAVAGDRGRLGSSREPVDRAERMRRGALVALAGLPADPATPAARPDAARPRVGAYQRELTAARDAIAAADAARVDALADALAALHGVVDAWQDAVRMARSATDHELRADARRQDALRQPRHVPPDQVTPILDDILRHAWAAEVAWALARERWQAVGQRLTEAVPLGLRARDVQPPSGTPGDGDLPPEPDAPTAPDVADPDFDGYLLDQARRYGELGEQLEQEAAALGLRWDPDSERTDPAASPVPTATDLLISALTVAAIRKRDPREVLAERFGGGQFVELAADPAGLAPDVMGDQIAALAERLRQGPPAGVGY